MSSLQVQELVGEKLEKWEPVIGLEIHTQLSTNTKMFCRCRLEFGADPNTLVCPVCLAHPGVLPVPNERAVEYAVKIGLALNCSIAPHTIFHRKNYFYPDNPKAYQISQYDNPICHDGYLEVPVAEDTIRVGITRAHMEEDAAKLVHAGSSGRIADSTHSYVDFNRAGTPLVEIVTEPDIHDAAHAKAFLQALRTTLLAIGVSDCNMEEGSLRCDANISVRPRGSSEFGVKTELKNMNSFSFIERGIMAEVMRQIDLIERDEPVEQSTMHYDPKTGSIRTLRSKEFAHDYRYFPEPDLVPIEMSTVRVDEIRTSLPELPLDRMRRFADEYELSMYDADVLNGSVELADAYEAAVKAAASADAKTIANWMMGEYLALQKDGVRATVEQVAAVVDLVAAGTISGQVGKDLLGRVAREGGDPVAIVEAEDLAQVGDTGELGAIVEEILDASPKQVQQYQGGKETLVGYFVGQVMKATQGKADPKVAKELVVDALGRR